MLSSRALVAVLLVALGSFPVQSARRPGPTSNHHRRADRIDAGFALDLSVSGGDPSVGPPADPPVRTHGDPRAAIATLAPVVDPAAIPDPVQVALRDIAGVKAERSGGLWLEGDVREGFIRLQWIAGHGNASVLQTAPDGKLTFSNAALMHVSRADRAGAGASLVLIDYIKANEGLYLIAQLIAAENRYCLYLGQHVPTAGDSLEIDGAINLDNNFDSRINTYRKEGLKLPNECPPDGFDSLVGINPAARWFNLRVKRMVPDGIIVFHELAEALAKVDFGLDYLPEGMRAGAHDTAVQRELKLQSERHDPDTVVTLGSNVMFKTREDFLKFKSDRETIKAQR